MKLTDKLVRKKSAPSSGAITLWDSGEEGCVKGFGLRIYAPTERSQDGARTFFINYRSGGRERRYRIGAYPAWTVAAARAEAKELRKRVDRGDDPAEEK